MEARKRTDSECARNRTWSEDIAKAWNRPIAPGENIEHRSSRYLEYFTLTDDQLVRMTDSFSDELETGLKIHKDDPDHEWRTERCSLKMLDSCVSTIPTGKEKATAYALDFGGSNFRAVRVKLDGDGKLTTTQTRQSLKDVAPELKKGLLDGDATASQLFDAFANSMKDFMAVQGDSGGQKWGGVGFTFSFPISQTDLKSATLMTWTKEFETGRRTNDPVEGMDVSLLLDQAFWRNEVPAKTVAVLNDTVGTLLSCAYEKPTKHPMCLIGVILGTGVNGCYFQEKAKDYGYKGTVINTELGNLDKGLPLTDVDLEVDFASEARGSHLYEKMISGGYLGEVCRRLIVKVFQQEAPQLAWVRDALPADACSRAITDTSANLEMVCKIFNVLWSWELTPQQALTIQKLCKAAFDRSAAMAGVVIAGMAKKTGRLSAGSGGLTCGIDGSLYVQNEFYQEVVADTLRRVLGDVSEHIHLQVTGDGSGKGAAILAAAMEAQKK